MTRIYKTLSAVEEVKLYQLDMTLNKYVKCWYQSKASFLMKLNWVWSNTLFRKKHGNTKAERQNHSLYSLLDKSRSFSR